MGKTKAPEKKMSNRIQIAITDTELAAIQLLAESQRVPLSTYARMKLFQAIGTQVNSLC